MNQMTAMWVCLGVLTLLVGLQELRLWLLSKLFKVTKEMLDLLGEQAGWNK